MKTPAPKLFCADCRCQLHQGPCACGCPVGRRQRPVYKRAYFTRDASAQHKRLAQEATWPGPRGTSEGVSDE